MAGVEKADYIYIYMITVISIISFLLWLKMHICVLFLELPFNLDFSGPSKIASALCLCMKFRTV